VIDFDLWNVGFWVYDLALALLPVGFNWPLLLAGEGSVNYADMLAFLAGYRYGRDVSQAELEVLPLVMESARFEFYLSAISTMIERGQPEEAEKFWALLVGVFRWFEAHPDWWR
jgi:Ser/Thr protein kinase RdoA (MazF antagonist)